MAPSKLDPSRPLNAILGQVTKVLGLALAGSVGSTSSQDAPVMVKLRTLVLVLLDSCADTSLGENIEMLAWTHRLQCSYGVE